MLIQKGNRTYSGQEVDLPNTLPSGSIFISTDTNKIFIYDDDNSPILYSSGGSTEPILVTRGEIEILVSTNSLLPGSLYTITDTDVNLYGGTEITLTAISSNELSLQGSGKFYCPKYDVSAQRTGYGIWTKQMEGEFSSIVGTFVINEVVTANNGATAKYLAQDFLEWISGDWSESTSISGATATANVSGFVSPSYSIGEIVHWGGKSWINNNGNIGASVDKYTLDAEWEEIPFNETDYNVYIDEIHYDFGNDMIIYRKDRYNNVVSGSNQVFVEFESPDGYGYGNPIKDFQWGCAQDDFNTDDYFYLGIQGNEVIDSYFETLNTRGRYIWFNKLSNFSYIANTTLSSSSYIINTTLSNSYIKNITLSSDGSIQNNILNNGSYIYNITLNNSSIEYNTLSISSIQNNTLSSFSFIENITLINSQLTFSNEIINKVVSNLEIRNSNISIPNTATIIFNTNLSKTIFSRLDSTPRLQYVNNSDVIVITDVDA